MDSSIHKGDRPLIVTVVTIYIAVHLTIAVLNQIALAQWSELHFQIRFGVMLLVGITVPLCLWRGQRWTRWAVLSVFLIGFVSNLVELAQRRTEYSALDLTIQVLRSVPEFVLVLCLFHPCATAWFRGGAHA